MWSRLTATETCDDFPQGQFLVAMPGMGDERFRDTVIYIVGHGDEGAMGLVVNQPVEDMRFADMLEELGLGEKDEIIRLPSTRARPRGAARRAGAARAAASCCIRRTISARAIPTSSTTRSA